MAKIFSIRNLYAIVLFLFIAGCAEVSYKPPGLPVKFSVDSEGKISVEAEASIVTPIGEFSLEAGFPLNPEDNCYYVVFRDQRKPTGKIDNVYCIKNGEGHYRINLTKADAVIEVDDSRAVIDITSGGMIVEFIPKEDEQQKEAKNLSIEELSSLSLPVLEPISPNNPTQIENFLNLNLSAKKISFSPSDEWLGLIDDKKVHFVNMNSKKLISQDIQTNSIIFTNDAHFLSTAQNVLRLRKIEENEIINTVLGLGGRSEVISAWFDGSTLISYHISEVTSSQVMGVLYTWSHINNTPQLINYKILPITLSSGDDVAAFSEDGQYLAVVLNTEKIALLRISDGTLMHTLEGHVGRIDSLSFSSNGSLLASGAIDKSIRIWRVADGMPLTKMDGHTDNINIVKFAPERDILYSGSDDGTLKIWNIDEGTVIETLNPENFVSQISFSLDGSLFAFSTRADGVSESQIEVWSSFPNLSRISSVSEHLGMVATPRVLSFYNEKFLMSGDESGIKIWQTSNGNLVSTLEKDFMSFVDVLLVSPDGSLLISNGSNENENILNVWDIQSQEITKEVGTFKGSITSVNLSPSRNTVAIVTHQDNSFDDVWVWRLPEFNLIQKFPTHLQRPYFSIMKDVSGAHFISETEILIVGADGEVAVWNISSNTMTSLYTLTEEMGIKRSELINENTIATFHDNYENSPVMLWNINNGTLLRRIDREEMRYATQFSDDASVLVTTDSEQMGVWDVKAARLFQVFLNEKNFFGGSKYTIFDLALSHNKKIIVVASDDGIKFYGIPVK